MYKYTTDQTRYVITFPFSGIFMYKHYSDILSLFFKLRMGFYRYYGLVEKKRTLHRGAVTFPSIPDFSICRHS